MERRKELRIEHWRIVKGQGKVSQRGEEMEIKRGREGNGRGREGMHPTFQKMSG